MNELYSFVAEQAQLARRLCEVLGLPERASLGEIVRRLQETIAAPAGGAVAA
jgi:hypothetical protein